MGNGGAMRAAPIGAYFADDLDALVEATLLSAEVTHRHKEGQVGAVAVALAAAFAWLSSRGSETGGLLEFVLKRTPASETRDGISRALDYPTTISPKSVARELGCGHRVTAQDTVPFSLWCAARHLGDYREALFETASAPGDVDTTCAIVGGIVALAVGREGLPPDWISIREPLPELC